MCEICRQNPCDPRCPNADTMENIIGRCDRCGDEISANYTYWIDEADNIFCSRDCAIEYYGIKETEYD